MTEREDCICMVIGWPDTWSKGAEKFFGWFYDIGILKDRYFKVGHAGLCLISKKTGEIFYYDFGRYTCDKGQGRARGANTDPNLHIPIKAQIDTEGNIQNIKEIVDYLFKIEQYTHGEGSIYFSLYHKMNLDKSLAFIENIQAQGSIKYTTFASNSTNCCRFVCGTLLAGTSSKIDQIKLVVTPTIRSSPVGNAVDTSGRSGVYRQMHKDAPLENFKMTRWDNLKLIVNNTIGNFVGPKIEREAPLVDEIERPDNVPEQATWLGGLGEGNWIHIEHIADNTYRAKGFYPNGELNYDTLVCDTNQELEPRKPFEIVYDCSRLFVTVVQEGKKIKLSLVEDYASISLAKVKD